jgi:hypothetical protein
MQSVRIIKDDHGEIIRTVEVSRNLHTNKYETFIGNFDPTRIPIINAPLPNPDDKSYKAKVRVMKKMVIGMFSLAVILPFIFVKYPALYTKRRILISYFETTGKYSIPIIDDRWDRSMVEWTEILSYAKEYGNHAASRKFYAIKSGKQKYLSPNYIKQKAKVFDRSYALLWNRTRAKKCKETLLEIQQIMKNDKELQNLLKKMFRQYFSNTLNEILDHKETYSYNYCYIRHYDPRLYKKQKSKFEKGKIKKAQVNGKIECGPFKVKPITDVPFKLTWDISIALVKFMRKQGDL